MRTHCLAVVSLSAAVALGGCAMFKERAPGYAANAMDGAAYRSTDVVLDRAEESMRNAGRSSGRSDEEKPAKKANPITRKIDADDVLVEIDGSFLIGKRIGDKVLVNRTGEKRDAGGLTLVSVRPAQKGDLSVGVDAYYTTEVGDMRRAAWRPGTITDAAGKGDGKINIGPETDLLWDGQVIVVR